MNKNIKIISIVIALSFVISACTNKENELNNFIKKCEAIEAEYNIKEQKEIYENTLNDLYANQKKFIDKFNLPDDFFEEGNALLTLYVRTAEGLRFGGLNIIDFEKTGFDAMYDSYKKISQELTDEKIRENAKQYYELLKEYSDINVKDQLKLNKAIINNNGDLYFSDKEQVTEDINYENIAETNEILDISSVVNISENDYLNDTNEMKIGSPQIWFHFTINNKNKNKHYYYEKEFWGDEELTTDFVRIGEKENGETINIKFDGWKGLGILKVNLYDINKNQVASKSVKIVETEVEKQNIGKTNDTNVWQLPDGTIQIGG